MTFKIASDMTVKEILQVRAKQLIAKFFSMKYLIWMFVTGIILDRSTGHEPFLSFEYLSFTFSVLGVSVWQKKNIPNQPIRDG